MRVEELIRPDGNIFYLCWNILLQPYKEPISVTFVPSWWVVVQSEQTNQSCEGWGEVKSGFTFRSKPRGQLELNLLLLLRQRVTSPRVAQLSAAGCQAVLSFSEMLDTAPEKQGT